MTETRNPPAAEHAPRSTRRGSAWSEVSWLRDTTFRLRLGGLFRTAWLAALCNRLASHRLSIDHAHARLTHGNTWIAELHLVALHGATDPLELAYIELTEDADAILLGAEPSIASADDADDLPAGGLELDSYRLVECNDHGGTLLLTLEADDALGLLGSLLASAAARELYPIEVHIETRSGRAYDSIWLAAAGGAPPSTSAREAMDCTLAGCVRVAAAT